VILFIYLLKQNPYKMSFITFVTERLADITARLNAIGTNAKKIDELPVQSTLDTASKIHVSKGGTSQSLSVQKIIDAVNSGSYDKLISIGDITLVGNEATIPADAQWKINEIYYSNLADIVIPINLCNGGFKRKVILVANTSNNIILINGDETDGSIVIRPNIPPGTVLVTEMDVTDSEIGTPTPPILGDIYVKKTERSNVFLTGSGVIDELILADEKATIVFNGSVTELKCITYSLLPYNGKKVILLNLQATPVTIKNATGTGVHFNLPNNEDYILKPNQAIEFYCDFTSFPYAHHRFIGEIRNQISDIENLETELNDRYTKSEADALLGNKLDASAYNQHFKGVYLTLSALNAAHPTGISGDAAQVNEVGATDVVNYSWDAEENIWVNNGTGGSGAVNTDALPEGTVNLYFQTARVLATLLTGISFATGGAIVSTDSVLVAFGKLQKQISDLFTDTVFGTFLNSLNAKITPVDADSISIVDSADSNKAKKVSLTNFWTYIKSKADTFYAPKTIPVFVISANTTLTDAHNGSIIILSTSCTVTIPNGLMIGFGCSFSTLAGVTYSQSLGGSVTLLNNVGTTMAEKLSFTLQNTLTTNQYLTVGNL